MTLYNYHPRHGKTPCARDQVAAYSSLDGMLANLPRNLTPLIKKAGKDEAEMRFSLSNLTEVQRHGMGSGQSDSIAVRLRLGNTETSLGYCVHCSNDQSSKKASHTPWLLDKRSKAPNLPYCQGRPSRATYQLSRMLWRHLQGGFVSLAETYARIASNIADLAKRCIVCGIHHAVSLRRPIPCSKPECEALFAAANFELHISDIWTDRSVVDLILSSMYATTLNPRTHRKPFDNPKRRMKLLHKCPISNAKRLHSMLNQLPSIIDLGKLASNAIAEQGNNFDLGTFMCQIMKAQFSPNQTHLLAETLIWACTSYGGFLTRVAGQYCITHFGKSPQFLFANASPFLEQRFAKAMDRAYGISTVLFHGTTLDRLHSILRCGLADMSETELMVNGAVGGPGIYMTSNPLIAFAYGTSMDYMKTCEDKRSPTGVRAMGWFTRNWRGSAFDGQGILLACEVAGVVHFDGPSEICILDEPERIMVRYVIFVERCNVDAFNMIRPMGLPLPQFPDTVPFFKRAFRKLKDGSW